MQGVENPVGKVVVVPYPAQGHINPLLEFSKRLAVASNGKLLVTFANTQHSQQQMLKASSRIPDSEENATNLLVRFKIFEDGHPEEVVRGADLPSDEEALRTIGSKSFETLLTSIHDEGPPILCIVYDSFLPWVPSIAHKMGIPCAFLWTQSCAVFSLYRHAHRKGLKKVLNIEDMGLGAGMPPLKVSDLPSYLQEYDKNDKIRQWFVNQMDHLFESQDKPQWVLSNSFYELEEAEIMSVSEECNVITVGPLIPSGFLESGKSAEAEGRSHMWKVVESKNWLDSKSDKSVVYVSFGSLKAPPIEQIHQIAKGLLGSGHAFLWVIRPDEGSNIEDILPSRFIEDCGDKGMVVPWCSQMQVLSHPAVGAFLSHCGWNSTMESISQGVPMLAASLWSDQVTNAFYLSQVWKTGLLLERDVAGILKSEVIENGLKVVLKSKEGEEMRTRAYCLRDAARKAVSKDGSSYKNIREFAKEVIAKGLVG